jgi:hypothetical protein
MSTCLESMETFMLVRTPIAKDWEVLCTIVDFWVVVERHLDTDSI